MTDTALIENGVVTQVWRETEAASLAETHPGWTLHEFPSNSAVCGMVWDGVTLANPPPPAITKAGLIAYAQAKRASVVDAGCVVNGIPIWTDSDAQASLTGAVVASQVIGAAFAAKWKGRDGNFYPVDGPAMVQLAMGAMTFVNTAFGVESGVKDAINAETITTKAQIDAASWPLNT